MKILITGGTGFVGPYLVDYFSKDNSNEVYISSRKKQEKKCIQLDLNDIKNSKAKLLHYKFDKIFHLAYQSSVHISFEQPYNTLLDNITTSLNLLKISQELDTKIIIAGTSEIYKSSNTALTEESEIDIRSPYSLSKLTIDHFVRLMTKQLDLKVNLLRLFNHTGPGQETKFVLSSFACQLAKIKLGLQEPLLKVGNLNIKRDFLDVRDVVRAYSLVSDDNTYGEVYNVCSGAPYELKNVLDQLIQIANVKVDIFVDPKLVRPLDILNYYGDYSKINKKFGWKPEIKIEETLENLFKFWMEKLK